MKRRVHYVLSTHWDREWHQTFQDFRYRLVRLVDHVIAGWEEGRLKGPFQTDGQAILIEDYLEVRPERRQKIERLAGDGKLVIGPWYALPDEFTVSGEALIRNLRLGREIARSLGARPSSAAFACDLFGHASQMPQIFAGFGIQGGFIWRGTNTQGRRNVLWTGADGTLLPCIRFGEVGYCDFSVKVRGGGDHTTHETDTAGFLDRLEEYLAHEALVTDVDPILMFDGCDHQEWDQSAYTMLLQRMARADDRFEIVHSSLDGYLDEMLPQQDRIQTRLAGELREPGLQARRPEDGPFDVDRQYVIPGVLSSRVWLKQANSVCQTLLCHWAEPLSAFASAVLGTEYPQGYLNLAWRWLLKNHPHDSIDGCSIDQVHRDMVYRFDQSRMISHRLADEATHQIASSVQGDLTAEDLRVVVFNPLPRAVDRVTELALQIPTDWPTFNEFFGFEPKPAFRIFDEAGEELAYQRLSQAKNRLRWRLHGAKFPESIRYHEVKVALRLSIPASGYTTLNVRSGYEAEHTRHPSAPGLAISERAMANEHVLVEIQANGTLTLTDKRTGRIYRHLLTFEDAADIGDGWYHGMAVNDQVFASTACWAQVALVHNSPLLTTFRIRTAMSLPRGLDFERMQRADDFVDVVIDSLVTLRLGQDYVEVKTTVENTADDHRMRVLLPSGAKAETYLTDSQFDVVERPIALRQDNHLYGELEVETRPQQSWTAVYDAQGGLAVISDGLLESAVRDLPERPIALTLFRSTGRTVGTTGEPDGQMRGSLTFNYWIVPLQGEPDRTRLCELGQGISAGLKVAQLRPQDVALYRAERSLPSRAGFLRLVGRAVITSIRQLNGALEVRMFNPLDETITATLAATDWPAGIPRPGRVCRVDLESNSLGDPQPMELETSITLKRKQIVTLRLEV